jgi:hypothetical protein
MGPLPLIAAKHQSAGGCRKYILRAENNRSSIPNPERLKSVCRRKIIELACILLYIDPHLEVFKVLSLHHQQP